MPAFTVCYMFTKKSNSGQRSGEAASNADRKPITHPAFGLFWRPGMSIPRFLRFFPSDCLTYVRRVISYCKTGVPTTFLYEYAESVRSLSESAFLAYLQTYYGYPGLVPTLTSLQARAANPSAEIEYISALADDTAAREEWEKIISRLIELLRWMDESNEVYEGWTDEVWEGIEARSKVENEENGETIAKAATEGAIEAACRLKPQDSHALLKVYNEVESAQANAKHEFFVIMEEIWENLWD